MVDPDCEFDSLILGCEVGETCEEGVCIVDENSTDVIPVEWTCDPVFFIDSTCDCNCGFPDPVCNNLSPEDVIFGCFSNETCIDGLCELKTITEAPTARERQIAPPEWTCNPQYFDDLFCDCNCGVPDTDCENLKPSDEVFGCDFLLETCQNGLCVPSKSPTERPTAKPTSLPTKKIDNVTDAPVGQVDRKQEKDILILALAAFLVLMSFSCFFL